jgi:paraquat-inducible protein A
VSGDAACAEAGHQGALIACHGCDLLLVEKPLAEPGATACCPRCGCVLYRGNSGRVETVLALSLAAAILVLMTNVFPILGLNIQGHRVDATLISASFHLWDEGMQALAVLVGMTTVVAPVIELMAFFWLYLPLSFGQRPPGFAAVFLALHSVHPWGMVEVFMLGVLVSLVKLAHFAEVIPGVGIWAMAALMLVMTAIAAAFDARVLWQAWEDAGDHVCQ